MGQERVESTLLACSVENIMEFVWKLDRRVLGENLKIVIEAVLRYALEKEIKTKF